MLIFYLNVLFNSAVYILMLKFFQKPRNFFSLQFGNTLAAVVVRVTILQPFNLVLLRKESSG